MLGLTYLYALIVMLVVGILVQTSPKEKNQLQHVHLLFRHGDRSPIYGFPNDGFVFNQTWPAGSGQLTDKGIVQQFKLGRWLRTRYRDFIPPEYNASHFHMRSTDIDRTLMSALSNIAGFYENSTSPLSKFGVQWSPIPVHTVQQKNDVLLGIAECPMLNQLQLQQMNSVDSIQFQDKHKQLFDLLSARSGVDTVDRHNVWLILDDLICLKAHGLKVPDWITPAVFEELQAVGKYYWNVQFVSSPEILRLEIGVFLHSFVDHVQSLITKGDASASVSSHHISASTHLSTQHLMAYSAHDTDVTYLLGGLGVYDGEPIDYASAVMLELLGPDPPADATKFRLRVVYKRSWEDLEGRALQLPPCKGEPPEAGCDFTKVLAYIQPLLLDREAYATSCAVANSSSESTIQMSVDKESLKKHLHLNGPQLFGAIFLSASIALSIVLTAFVYMKRRRTYPTLFHSTEQLVT